MRNLLLCLSLIFFVACGSGENGNNTDNSADSTATDTSTQEPKDPEPAEDSGMKQSEWDHLMSGVGDMSTVQGIDSYVQTASSAKDRLRKEVKDYGGEVDHHFEGYYMDDVLILGMSEWSLEPSSGYKTFYFHDGEPVFITHKGHTMTGEGAETFTYFMREAYLDHGTVLRGTERSTHGEYTMEPDFDFSPFEAVEFTPEEDMLDPTSMLDGLKGLGEWAGME